MLTTQERGPNKSSGKSPLLDMPESHSCPGPIPNGESAHRPISDTDSDVLWDFEHPMGIEAVRTSPQHDAHGDALGTAMSVALYLRSSTSASYVAGKTLRAVPAALVPEGGQGLDRLDLRLLCSSGEATSAVRGGTRLLAAVDAQRSPRCARGRGSCHVRHQNQNLTR